MSELDGMSRRTFVVAPAATSMAATVLAGFLKSHEGLLVKPDACQEACEQQSIAKRQTGKYVLLM